MESQVLHRNTIILKTFCGLQPKFGYGFVSQYLSPIISWRVLIFPMRSATFRYPPLFDIPTWYHTGYMTHTSRYVALNQHNRKNMFIPICVIVCHSQKWDYINTSFRDGHPFSEWFGIPVTNSRAPGWMTIPHVFWPWRISFTTATKCQLPYHHYSPWITMGCH